MAAKGESGDQDRFGWPHAKRHESQCQGIGATCAGDRVRGAAERREAGLEVGDLRTHDVLPVREYAGEGSVQSILDPRLLGFQIDEPSPASPPTRPAGAEFTARPLAKARSRHELERPYVDATPLRSRRQVVVDDRCLPGSAPRSRASLTSDDSCPCRPDHSGRIPAGQSP